MPSSSFKWFFEGKKKNYKFLNLQIEIEEEEEEVCTCVNKLFVQFLTEALSVCLLFVLPDVPLSLFILFLYPHMTTNKEIWQ